MKFKKYYLAYGSNLNLDQMKRRCPHAKVVGKAKIEGYRLAFKGFFEDFAYLTIEEAEGKSVDVGVYEITYTDEKYLDYYEGYPNNYFKKMMKVNLDGKSVDAMIYIMSPDFEYFMPSENYFYICFVGYCDFGFDTNTLLDTLWYTEEKNKQNYSKNNRRYLGKTKNNSFKNL